ADAVAAVADVEFKILSTPNDMMQPEANGQLMVPPVMALPATLRKMRSVFVLLNSVIGEQPTLAVVSVGPTFGVLMTLAVIPITHNALTVPLVLHTYKSPVPFTELL